jgi:hypothetical protein
VRDEMSARDVELEVDRIGCMLCEDEFSQNEIDEMIERVVTACGANGIEDVVAIDDSELFWSDSLAIRYGGLIGAVSDEELWLTVLALEDLGYIDVIRFR